MRLDSFDLIVGREAQDQRGLYSGSFWFWIAVFGW